MLGYAAPAGTLSSVLGDLRARARRRNGAGGAGVFISYRREDSSGWAGRLFDRLAEAFGRDRVFIDVDSLAPGEDFAQVIGRTLESCDVLLALIGPRWLMAEEPGGRPRLHSRDDFVALEIAAALERDVRVIPVLVGDAEMPSSDDLPPSLRGLTRRQALELDPTGFHRDVDHLIKVLVERAGLEKVPPPDGPGRPRQRPWLAPAVMGAAAVIGAAVLAAALMSGSDTGAQPSSDSEATATDEPTSSATVPAAPPDTPRADPGSSAPDEMVGEAGSLVQLLPVAAAAPSTAPPGRDANGNEVSYDARNLIDGRPDTAWRAPGDVAGDRLAIDLGGVARVRRVGLVPGYAKVDRLDGVDRFAQNRKVEQVRWRFQDGTQVVQDLASLPRMQYVDVDARSQVVEIEILRVGPHGGRDFTAVSEVELLGER